MLRGSPLIYGRIRTLYCVGALGPLSERQGHAARGGGTSAPLSGGDDRKPPLPRSWAASDAADPARVDASGAGLHSCGAILGGGNPRRSGADNAQSRKQTDCMQEEGERKARFTLRSPSEGHVIELGVAAGDLADPKSMLMVIRGVRP
jgi:hypothetical protein